MIELRRKQVRLINTLMASSKNLLPSDVVARQFHTHTLSIYLFSFRLPLSLSIPLLSHCAIALPGDGRTDGRRRRRRRRRRQQNVHKQNRTERELGGRRKIQDGGQAEGGRGERRGDPGAHECHRPPTAGWAWIRALLSAKNAINSPRSTRDDSVLDSRLQREQD